MDELIAQVEKAVARVKTHVDKRIAHLDRQARDSAAPATWGDLNRALDELFSAFETVCLWVDGASYTTLVPVWQYDWKEVLRHPWLPPSRGSVG